MRILTNQLLVPCFVLLLLVSGGCGKKAVPTYSSPTAGGGADTASGADGTRQGTISEEITPGEESLDAGGRESEPFGGFSASADKDSEEYKKAYGRSSSELLPIYFDFDQASIRGDQVSRLEHNADYMKNNPNRNLVVEGNSDERGTNEYNLALGERRALNAKNYLVELGVEEYRVRTVSYGEERPLFTGQTEFDWSQNRRDDFVLE